MGRNRTRCVFPYFTEKHEESLHYIAQMNGKMYIYIFQGVLFIFLGCFELLYILAFLREWGEKMEKNVDKQGDIC